MPVLYRGSAVPKGQLLFRTQGERYNGYINLDIEGAKIFLKNAVTLS